MTITPRNICLIVESICLIIVLQICLKKVDALDSVCHVSICLIVCVASNLSYSLCPICLIVCVKFVLKLKKNKTNACLIVKKE